VPQVQVAEKIVEKVGTVPQVQLAEKVVEMVVAVPQVQLAEKIVEKVVTGPQVRRVEIEALKEQRDELEARLSKDVDMIMDGSLDLRADNQRHKQDTDQMRDALEQKPSVTQVPELLVAAMSEGDCSFSSSSPLWGSGDEAAVMADLAALEQAKGEQARGKATKEGTGKGKAAKKKGNGEGPGLGRARAAMSCTVVYGIAGRVGAWCWTALGCGVRLAAVGLPHDRSGTLPGGALSGPSSPAVGSGIMARRPCSHEPVGFGPSPGRETVCGSLRLRLGTQRNSVCTAQREWLPPPRFRMGEPRYALQCLCILRNSVCTAQRERQPPARFPLLQV